MAISSQPLNCRIIRGESGISADVAIRLEQAIGSSADVWLGMQMTYDLAQIRLKKPPKLAKLTGALDEAA